MIIADARRILELRTQIHALGEAMEALTQDSEIAQRLSTIDEFGKTSIAELAGGIEASVADGSGKAGGIGA